MLLCTRHSLVVYWSYKSNLNIVSAFKEHREEMEQLKKRGDMCHEKILHRAHGDHVDWLLNPVVRDIDNFSEKYHVKGYWRDSRDTQ